MLSDLQCVQQCAATYALPPTLPVPQTGVDCRITVIEGDGGSGIVVAFRGSFTIEDWARDFFTAPDREHPQFGFCHAGFLDAADSIVEAVLKELSFSSAALPVYVTGHSLGGAEALGVGAMMKLAGKTPAAIVTFGAPRFGMAKFAAYLAEIPVRQYRRGNDVVPLLPFDAAPFLLWCDTRAPLIPIGAPQRNPLDCHHIDGYVSDIAAYLQKQAA